jgi:GntR family histidine utilization transcriptional repressor
VANALPLYERIKTTIARRIQLDEWPTDFQVPNEEALAREFDASRLTVRRALRELQAEGLVVRIQGRGTFVVGPTMQCAIFGVRDVSEEVEESGGIHTSEVVTLRALATDDPLARLLNAGPDTVVVHSRLVHKEDGTPIQLEDRFVNADEAPAYLDQDFSRITTHAWLTRETEVTSVDTTIRAVRPDAVSRHFLKIDETQPCLLLDRRTWRGSIPVTRSRFLYPGDRYRLRSTHEATPRRLTGGGVSIRSQPRSIR